MTSEKKKEYNKRRMYRKI